MNHVEVTLYFNELQLRAVEHELSSNGLTLEDKLKEHFAFLYDQLVPPEKQLGIEAEIEQIEAALAGKEIVPPEETEDEVPDEDEDEAPVMRM